MARVQIDERELRAYVRGQMTKRARAALAGYQAYERKARRPTDPFAQSDGPRRQSIKNIPDGIRIAVESPGAEFFEEGNKDSGEYINPSTPEGRLWLRLKHKSGRGLSPEVLRNARIQMGRDGKPYLVLKRVRTYEGRHALRKSVLAAFGLTPY